MLLAASSRSWSLPVLCHWRNPLHVLVMTELALPVWLMAWATTNPPTTPTAVTMMATRSFLPAGDRSCQKECLLSTTAPETLFDPERGKQRPRDDGQSGRDELTKDVAAHQPTACK